MTKEPVGRRPWKAVQSFSQLLPPQQQLEELEDTYDQDDYGRPQTQAGQARGEEAKCHG